MVYENLVNCKVKVVFILFMIKCKSVYYFFVVNFCIIIGIVLELKFGKEFFDIIRYKRVVIYSFL